MSLARKLSFMSVSSYDSPHSGTPLELPSLYPPSGLTSASHLHNPLDLCAVAMFETTMRVSGARQGACIRLTANQKSRTMAATGGFWARSNKSAFLPFFLKEVLRQAKPIFASNARELETGAPILADLDGMNLAVIPFQMSGPEEGVVWAFAYDPNRAPLNAARREDIVHLAEMARLAFVQKCTTRLTDQMKLEQFHASEFLQCHWVVDLRTNSAQSVSSGFEELFDLPATTLQGDLTAFVTRIHAEDKSHVLLQFHTSLDAEIDIEFRVITGNGEIRWVWLRSFALNENGAHSSSSASSITRMLFIAEDVTIRKDLEHLERSKQAELAANAKMNALGELAHGVAHEINNPLTVIAAKASELKRLQTRGQLTKAALFEIADKIETTSMRIADLIQSLKSLAARDNEATFHKVAFEQIFNEIRNLTTETFSNEIELRLPSFPKNFGAEVHYTQITQLFVNLLNNAVDALRGEGVLNRSEFDGERAKWVEIDYAESEDSVFLYVTDSGPGIPLKIRGKIFDPFFTTKPAGKGTGLGLSLAQGIVLRHNGTIRLDTLNSHTRFVVQLPKRQEKRR